MKKTIKSSRIIIINSVLMLCLITLLIVQNIYFLNKNNTTLSIIDDVYNRKIDVVMLMAKVVRERSLNMVMMYFSDDPWEQDKIFIQFHKLKLVYLKLNKELKKLGLSDNEKNIFNDMLEKLNKAELIQIDIVERIQSGENKNVQHDISNKDFPIEMEILENFDTLIGAIRKNTDIARIDAKKQYQKIIFLIALLAILVLFVALYLIKKSLRQIVKLESDLIHQAETLSWDATHDALTNVYNRRWLEHKFELMREENDAEDATHSLLYIDLDEFKPINDNYGHVTGDHFLCGITRELEKCIRQNDTLARMGGDEFAILLENCNVEKATSIAECLISRVKKFHLTIDDNKISIAGCSVGINTFQTQGADFVEIVKQADSACYEAKNNGKNRFYLFPSSS